MLKNVRVRFFYSLFSRIQSKYGKIRTKKNRYSNIFQAAKTLKKNSLQCFSTLIKFCIKINHQKQQFDCLTKHMTTLNRSVNHKDNFF